MYLHVVQSLSLEPFLLGQVFQLTATFLVDTRRGTLVSISVENMLSYITLTNLAAPFFS